MILCSQLRGTYGDFVTRLFLSITANEGTNNVAIAPLAIQESLALLYLGSDAEGAIELKKHLELQGDTKTAAVEGFSELPTRIDTADVSLQSSFKFYVDSMFPIRATFHKDAMDHLHSFAESVKFNKDPELATRISMYFESTLHRRKLQSIIKSSEINSTTRSIVVQGFYFEGNFSKPFKQMMKRRKFFTQPGSSQAVVTYITVDDLPYANLAQLNCQGIELPYRNSNLSMLILLPNKGTTIKALETQLANTDILSLAKHFDNLYMQVEIPKFSIVYEQELTASLKRLGIKSIFENPEFHSLTDTPFFSISMIKHKGSIEFTCGEVECEKVSGKQQSTCSLSITT